jgi:hypothetical protein
VDRQLDDLCVAVVHDEERAEPGIGVLHHGIIIHDEGIPRSWTRILVGFARDQLVDGVRRLAD